MFPPQEESPLYHVVLWAGTGGAAIVMTCSWTSALFFLFSAVRDLVLVDVSEILLGRRCIFGPVQR